MYPPFFFGSTYITLIAQNCKTIRIIFLPKCTQKNCDFYTVFYTFFLRISLLSGKTKSALAMIFCGYFYINRPWWVSPLFNSAKIRTKGAIGLHPHIYRDFSPPSLYDKLLIYKSSASLLIASTLDSSANSECANFDNSVKRT